MSTLILGPGPPPPPLPPPPPNKRRKPADKVVLPPMKGQKLRVKKKKRETRKRMREDITAARANPTGAILRRAHQTATPWSPAFRAAGRAEDFAAKEARFSESFEAWFARGTPTDEGELEFEFEQLDLNLEEDEGTTPTLINDGQRSAETRSTVISNGPAAGPDNHTSGDRDRNDSVWADFISRMMRRVE